MNERTNECERWGRKEKSLYITAAAAAAVVLALLLLLLLLCICVFSFTLGVCVCVSPIGPDAALSFLPLSSIYI